MAQSINTSKILKEIILPAGDLVLRQKMLSRLKFLERAQWWNEARISAYQNDLLNSLLHTSYNEVPFYKELYDSNRINIQQIDSVDKLNQLPIVTKDMLRKAYPSTTRKTNHRTHVESTSGSTGSNFFILEDQYTSGWYRASFLLALEWAGWNFGEEHIQMGVNISRSIDRKFKDWLLNCNYYSAFNLDDTQIEKIMMKMEKNQIKHLWGFPGSIYSIANFALKNNWRQHLHSIVTWGDTLLPQYRQKIEEAFTKKVNDTYGCSEGIQISAQCEYGNYHIHALDAIVEYINDSGKPVSEGSLGNIVVTRLHPGVTPLIRYAIGDIGKSSLTKICPCGRGFPLMESIQGRTAEVVVTPSGHRLITQFFTGILAHYSEIRNFQVIQTNINSIILYIEPNENFSISTKNQILNIFKEKGVTDIIIKIELVDQIPLTSAGKNRFIISKLDQS